MNIIKSMDGKKFNTGTLIVALTWLLQQTGMIQGVAAHESSLIAYGIGSLVMVIGYLHQWIKSGQVKQVIQEDVQKLIPKTPEDLVKEIQTVMELAEKVKAIVTKPATIPTTIQPVIADREVEKIQTVLNETVK